MSELRELAAQATPGPWIRRFWGDLRDVVITSPTSSGNYLNVCEHAGDNAEFIAACDPQTVIAILDERDRYRAALEFYADHDSWRYLADMNGEYTKWITKPADKGDIARKALKP